MLATEAAGSISRQTNGINFMVALPKVKGSCASGACLSGVTSCPWARTFGISDACASILGFAVKDLSQAVGTARVAETALQMLFRGFAAALGARCGAAGFTGGRLCLIRPFA